MDLATLESIADIYLDGNLLKTQDGCPIALYENGKLSGSYEECIDIASIKEAYVRKVLDQYLLIINTPLGEQALKYVDPSHNYLQGLMTMDRLALSYLEMSRIFNELYPDGVGYWDELNERPFLSRREGDPPLADELKASIYADCEERIRRAFGRAVKCPKAVIWDTVIEKIYLNKRSPVREWFQSLPEWDGVSRIGTLFRDTLGASSRLEPEMDALYLKEVTECWMVGIVARQHQETKHEVIPCLIGRQELGKSTMISLLSPNKDWYLSTKTTIDNEKEFLDNVRGHIIVEFGEGSTLKSDPESLKEFLSRSSDSYRQSYARYSQSYPRRWVPIVTTNDPVPLVDGSGNRRYYPMYCGDCLDMRIMHPLKDSEEFKEYSKLLWAEAYHLYKTGHRWWIPYDMDIGQSLVQDSATRVNVEADYINAKLDERHELRAEGSKISQSEIFLLVWPDTRGIATKDMKNAIHTWQADKDCPWSARVVNMYDPDKNKYVSKRGFYRMKAYE